VYKNENSRDITGNIGQKTQNDDKERKKIQHRKLKWWATRTKQQNPGT